MKKYKGSCLCTRVAFEVTGEFKKFFLCHCNRCQKVTGSAHAANLFSMTAKLAWVSGKDNVKTFHLPDTRFTKSFCMTCGSALPSPEANDTLLVPAGSLDCDVEIRPDGHIFMGSKANWDQDFDLVEKFENLPI